MQEYFVPLTIITVLIVVNGLFVAAEFAVAGSQHTRVAQMAEEGSRLAQMVLSILRNPDLINRYLSTAQIGITIATLGLGMYGEHTVAHWLEAPLERFHLGEGLTHSLALVLAVAIITYLHVVIGEMIPKSLALNAPERSAVTLNGIMTVFDRLFLPLTVVLNGAGNAILRMAGVPTADAAARLVSSEELEFIVAESSEEGLLRPREQVFLENILDFQERTVSQIMTPRNRLIGVPADLTRMEALDLVCDNSYSRYPVYEGDLDHIIGILHTKDLARDFVGVAVDLPGQNGQGAVDGSTLSHKQSQPPSNQYELGDLIRDAHFVPESLALEQMLAQFQQNRSQIAVVVDEYGGVAGMVTMEDIVEELVGEIRDEYDEDELVPFEEIGHKKIRVRGDLLIDELEQHYELEIEEDEADTVAGWMMVQLGHVSKPGESVTYQGAVFTVEEMEGLAIRTIVIELPEDGVENGE